MSTDRELGSVIDLTDEDIAAMDAMPIQAFDPRVMPYAVSIDADGIVELSFAGHGAVTILRMTLDQAEFVAGTLSDALKEHAGKFV